jgi:DNA ligase (NAD+)
MNSSLYKWWNDLGLNGFISNKSIFYALVKELDFIDNEELLQKSNNNYTDLTGKTFVVTGKFKHFNPRKKLEELIANCGGKVSGSVSAKTDMLINNDTESGSKKNKSAKQHGVQIVNENDFMKYLNYTI